MEGVSLHRHCCPTMSGNFIVGEWGRSSKQGRKPNESRDLGNANTNIVLPNTTALTSLIKTQESSPTPQQQREGLKMCVSCDAYEHVRSESNYVCIFCFDISANYWCN